jgi:hypothetical protein
MCSAADCTTDQIYAIRGIVFTVVLPSIMLLSNLVAEYMLCSCHVAFCQYRVPCRVQKIYSSVFFAECTILTRESNFLFECMSFMHAVISDHVYCLLAVYVVREVLVNWCRFANMITYMNSSLYVVFTVPVYSCT